MSAPLTSRETGSGLSPALLVVDASSGFTDTASPLGADYSEEIRRIALLMDFAHHHHWPCFLSTVVYHEARQASVFREKLPDLNVLIPDSPLVKIDARLPVLTSDRVFEKQLASCFFDTPLHDWLKAAKVDTVIVTGFTTSGCVRASAVDALQHNFRTLVVTDAVGDRDAEAHQANLRDLGLKYADLVTTETLLKS